MCENLQVLSYLTENGKRGNILQRDTCYEQTQRGDAWWDICISHASYASITLGKNITAKLERLSIHSPYFRI